MTTGHVPCVTSLPLQVAACLQNATPQEVAVVQRSLADAEARAAAEEGAAAAAEQAAAATAAEHAAAWAHQANGQAFSVSSSADMSQSGFAAAAEQHHYAAYGGEQQAYVQQGHTDMQSYGGQHVQGLAGQMAGMSLNVAAAQQQLEQQQQQQLLALQQQQQQYRPTSAGISGQMQHIQLQQQPGQTHQLLLANQQQLVPTSNQHISQMPHLQQGGAASGPAIEPPRDVLGRPVPLSPAGHTIMPAVHQPGVGALQQGLTTGTIGSPLQPLQQQQQPVLAGLGSPQAAPPPCAQAGAAALAAAAAVAAGDAGSQARHLTVLVHRLQSRPAEDVLAELAACASVLCRQAWEDNFSKVCASSCHGLSRLPSTAPGGGYGESLHGGPYSCTRFAVL